jgi:uncharacterized protein (DUF1697 family)
MARYAAFLRGVSPMNLKMSDLKMCLEKAGFEHVVTVLSSGNVVFDSQSLSEKAIERKIEQAMEKHLDRVFLTIVRKVDSLSEMIESDPYKAFKLKPKSKRVVTFLHGTPRSKPKLPIERDGVRILKVVDGQVYSVYEISPKGPVFMQMLEKEFGKSVSTRTWETISKVIKK